MDIPKDVWLQLFGEGLPSESDPDLDEVTFTIGEPVFDQDIHYRSPFTCAWWVPLTEADRGSVKYVNTGTGTVRASWGRWSDGNYQVAQPVGWYVYPWDGNPPLRPQPTHKLVHGEQCPGCAGSGTRDDAEVCHVCDGHGWVEADGPPPVPKEES